VHGWVGAIEIGYLESEKVIKSILGLCIGLPTASPHSTDSPVGKPKTTTCKSYCSVDGRGSLCM